MPTTASHIRDGFHTVVPYLTLQNAVGLSDFISPGRG
jgi:hypothetical protein